ncbi:Membrane protein OS=Streptomyces antimycoticus OX=68175 GN=SANT12839_060220 PE=3 SV=1 [Streptomyces antimycoticus]
MSGQDAPAQEPHARVSVARWAADLAMGARFAVTGGRESWARTIMTAVGVGLGVALLLLASSVPTMYQARHDRGDARSALSFMDTEVRPGPETLRIANAGTTYRDRDIGGMVMAPDGKGEPPLPTGIDRIPAAGEMWVSPALKKLLDSDEGKLLRDRFPYRTIGVIGDSGLSGPTELTYYAGISQKAFGHVNSSDHIDHWGERRTGKSEPLDPALLLLIIVGCVVLLLPVLIFIATAARFGGERRDRRLAALRLVGADIHMTRRIAAGASLFGSLLGLAVGGGLFLLGRELISGVDIWGISFFASDIVPSAPLALVIAAAVPASAVMVTLIALRGIAIEPLGVVRNAKPKAAAPVVAAAAAAAGHGHAAAARGSFGARTAGRDRRHEGVPGRGRCRPAAHRHHRAAALGRRGRGGTVRGQGLGALAARHPPAPAQQRHRLACGQRHHGRRRRGAGAPDALHQRAGRQHRVDRPGPEPAPR